MVNDWSHLSHAQAPSTRDLGRSLINACVDYICAPRFLTRAIAKKQMDFVLSPVKATVTNAVRSMS